MERAEFRVPAPQQLGALLVADKPSGLLCQPGRGPHLADSLLTRLREQWPGAQLVHRLDRDTSGLVLLALDPALHRALSQLFAERLVRKTYRADVLGVPAQGYTNIEGGLDAGLRELRQSRRRERVGMLFSDGVANVGWDPVPVAGRFPRLHVVHLGAHHVQGSRTCRDMARAGRGKLYRARTYADLPGVVRGAVRELFR